LQSQPTPSGSSDSTDIDELLNKSLTQDAVNACNSLRTQISELTGIVRQQRDKINSMDQKLSTVLSMLKNSVAHQSQVASAWSQPSAAGSTAGLTATSSSVSAASTSQSDISSIVHHTLNDVARRKRNVIVTGLPEESEVGTKDRETFDEFCAKFLSMKPALAAGDDCCVRIGKALPDKPRRLLVKMGSEEAATTLLRAAPSLRSSAEPYISKNMFVNADLSPAAAKIAFEKRKRRRESRKERAEQSLIDSSTAAAASATSAVVTVITAGPATAVSSRSDKLINTGSLIRPMNGANNIPVSSVAVSGAGAGAGVGAGATAVSSLGVGPILPSSAGYAYAASFPVSLQSTDLRTTTGQFTVSGGQFQPLTAAPSYSTVVQPNYLTAPASGSAAVGQFNYWPLPPPPPQTFSTFVGQQPFLTNAPTDLGNCTAIMPPALDCAFNMQPASSSV